MLSRLIPAALLLAQLPLAAFAHPAARRSSAMAEWTLRGFHWKCSPDKTLCIYGFSLAEDSGPGASAETPAFCHFAIRAKDDKPAYKTGFSNIPCENLSQYRISSVFGDNGYMILSVENVDEQRRAYFNYDVSELENSEMAAAQQSVAYAVTASSLPSYTDEDSEDDPDDFAFSPVILGPIVDDSDNPENPEELPVPDDGSELENLAALDTPDDADENGSGYDDNNSDDDVYNDYNDYTDGPVIEMAEVDTAEEEADDSSDPSDANINAAVDEPTEEDAGVTEVEPAEVVFEAAYAAEAPDYDLDESDDYEDEAAETPETLDEPILATVADLEDGYTDGDSADSYYADDGYADDDEQADENLIVTPDDSIITILDTPPYTLDSENGENSENSDYSDNDYEDNSGYDATTILSVPQIPELWAMRNISRKIEYDPNSVVMQFAIDVLPDGPKSIPCNFRVDLDKNIDPMFASWFVQQCEDSGWFLSWGYNQLTESAVATLINPEKTEEAWFGWNLVNSHIPDTMLNSVGPGIVQTCNC